MRNLFILTMLVLGLGACSAAQVATVNTDAANVTAVVKPLAPIVGAVVPGAAVVLSSVAQAACAGQAAANLLTVADPANAAKSSEASVLLGDACTW